MCWKLLSPLHKLFYIIHITTHEVNIIICILGIKKQIQEHIVNDTVDSYLDNTNSIV